MNWDCKLSTHKFFEIQLDKFDFDRWFEFHMDWTRKGDHAGFDLRICIGAIFFCINIYDHRHWNWDEDRFMTDKDCEDEESQNPSSVHDYD